jgi:hypothetical protein
MLHKSGTPHPEQRLILSGFQTMADCWAASQLSVQLNLASYSKSSLPFDAPEFKAWTSQL